MSSNLFMSMFVWVLATLSGIYDRCRNTCSLPLNTIYERHSQNPHEYGTSLSTHPLGAISDRCQIHPFPGMNIPYTLRGIYERYQEKQ